METINLGFRVKIYPNETQKKLFEQWFGASRFIWNKALGDHKEKRKTDEKCYYTAYSAFNQLTKWKQDEKLSWLRDIDVMVLRAPLKSLHEAFRRIGRCKSGYPKFKAKHKCKDSFTKLGNARKEGKKLFISNKLGKGFGRVKYRGDVPDGDMVELTITKDNCGDYWASGNVKCEGEHPEPETQGKILGIDMGCETFATLSNGEKIKHRLDELKKLETKRSRLQYQQRKNKKESVKYKKLKNRIAKISRKIHSIRRDTTRQETAQLMTRDIQGFSVEDLGTKNMMKKGGKRKKGLNRSIARQGWYNFTSWLEWKCQQHGKKLVKIDRFYPSSKTCYKCGTYHKGLKLTDRKMPCCGADRDLSASINIARQGIKTFAGGESENQNATGVWVVAGPPKFD